MAVQTISTTLSTFDGGQVPPSCLGIGKHKQVKAGPSITPGSLKPITSNKPPQAE